MFQTLIFCYNKQLTCTDSIWNVQCHKIYIKKIVTKKNALNHNLIFLFDISLLDWNWDVSCGAKLFLITFVCQKKSIDKWLSLIIRVCVCKILNIIAEKTKSSLNNFYVNKFKLFRVWFITKIFSHLLL